MGHALAMTTTDLFEKLVADVSAFAAEREWEQFHTPKNLAMALAGEAGELIAEFQWLTQEESKLDPADDRFRAAREEMADVMIYLIRLSTVLGIDLIDAAMDKLALNEKRYPAELSLGRSDRPTTG
jgi:dCTP diphosphatase